MDLKNLTNSANSVRKSSHISYPKNRQEKYQFIV